MCVEEWKKFLYMANRQKLIFLSQLDASKVNRILTALLTSDTDRIASKTREAFCKSLKTKTKNRYNL
jgi:hypothetical protein